MKLTTPPPPPPAPPRKISSGIGIRREGQSVQWQNPIENDGELEVPTTSFADPPTLAGRAQQEPANDAYDAYDKGFDDETQARRVDEYLVQATRDRSARDVNVRARQEQEQDHGPRTVPFNPHQAPTPNAGVNAGMSSDFAYDSLPSLEVRRPFDTYEAEFAERDPATQLHVARESARRMLAQPPAARTAGYGSPFETEARREESGPRERLPARDLPTVAPAYDVEDEGSWAPSPEIPPAPAVPRDLAPAIPTPPPAPSPPRRTPAPPPVAAAPPPPAPVERADRVPPGFIMGVQAIGNAPTDLQPLPLPMTPGNGTMSPHAMHHHSPLPGPPGPQYPQAYPQAQGQGHYSQPPMSPAAPPQMQYSANAYAMPPIHPVGHQIQDEAPPQGSKVGRFAWFFFGAVFGICFAFFATGYVPRFTSSAKKDDAQFPPPAPLPTQPAAVASAPPVTTAPPAATTATAPTTPPSTTPPPKVADKKDEKPADAKTADNKKAEEKKEEKKADVKVAPPSPPRVAPRGATARRSPPAPASHSDAPKPLPNSGSVSANDDETPIPPKPAAKKSGGGDMNASDILGDGL